MVKQNLDKLKARIVASEKINNLKNVGYSIFNPPKEPKVLFTFGCQRSGTTLIQRMVNLSPKVKMYGEGEQPYFHPKSDPDLQFRLRPDESIRELLQKELTHYISLKPIYDIQKMFEFLSVFRQSRAYFIFRHYHDVVQSHLSYYRDIHSDPRDYVRPLFDQATTSWMNEYLPCSLKKTLSGIDYHSITAEDAYALHWYARNSIALELMQTHEEQAHLVQTVCYEELLSAPEHFGRQIYNFANLGFNNDWLSIIRSEPLYRPLTCELSPAIKELCDTLFCELKGLTSYKLSANSFRNTG